VAFSRYLFRSRYLYDLDSVNFALAMGRFDPTVHQPHPPGYFLYIWLARVINVFFHDPNAALVAISIAASCGAVAVIYMLTFKWFGAEAAAFAGLIFLFSPITWFHGTVALMYIVEAFLSTLVGYLCWEVYCGRGTLAVPAGLVLGLGAGIRPSFSLFVLPLFLFSLWKVSRKRAAGAIAALGVAVLAWFIPMVEASGGLRKYISSFVALWRVAGGKETVFNSSPLTSLARLLAIVLVYALCFGSATLLSGRAFRRKDAAGREKTLFTWVWVTPGLLFFTFIFMLFVNSGYLLVIFPPVFAWLGLWGSEWYARLQWPKPLKLVLVGLFAAVNVLLFVEGPAYCSYRSVRVFEAELRDIQQGVGQIAAPKQTLIIGFDSHFLGYRHAGYYLPGYSIAEYPEVSLASGKRVFFMQNRDTQALERLPQGNFTNFLFFPLPSDDKRYGEYLARVRAKFPPHDLHTQHAGNHDFVMGPISDLPILFPDATQPPALYTSGHAGAGAVYSR
jgi:4-amino-4-deoxy-L-arabinose transferase-like glycosyltransferase